MKHKESQWVLSVETPAKTCMTNKHLFSIIYVWDLWLCCGVCDMVSEDGVYF
jgi:hypothetical protein